MREAFRERLIVELPVGGIQFAVRFTDGPEGPVDDVAVAAQQGPGDEGETEDVEDDTADEGGDDPDAVEDGQE
ncbi:hypothetical protein K4H02_28185, partial [Mycobacterium tuberculosis]|nr:hypothetical protein [Mycobacterium tuberculosis]